jgi:hypothetical protein
MTLQLSWTQCGQQEKVWCSFESVDLSNVKTRGVYIIWYNGNPGKVVRVGQGDIADRIRAHRSDPDVTRYASKKLFVTWAAVSEVNMDGVERYLANVFSPLVGDAFPDVTPVAVNSPWN